MAEMNKGLVVAKLKTAENLYESLNRAETNITQEITNTKVRIYTSVTLHNFR